MSDERSTPSATDENGAADDADSSTGLEPGGGPQRVVSEESVDDILDSLESAPDATASSEPTAVTETTESVTTEFDEDDVPEPDTIEPNDGADERSSGSVTEPDPTGAEPAAGVDETESSATTDAATGATDTTVTGATDTTEMDATDETSIDAAAASLPDDTDDASLEELADRIEAGAVTGADVRAAEAGEGRESTPEIDEVELSMDDLESAQIDGVENDDERSDDAGPLAGSVDRDGDAGTAAKADADESDDSPGLFARLKRFFSR